MANTPITYLKIQEIKELEMIKTATKILALSLILASLSGCQGKMEKVAKDVVGSKYGEEFEVVEIHRDSQDSFYAWLRPKSDPSIVVRAELTKDGSGSYDNYKVRKICHEISDKAESIAPNKYVIFTKNIRNYTYDASDAQTHLTLNPGDRFDVAVFSPESIDAATLYADISAMKLQLGISSGSINPILLSKNDLKTVKKELEKYDSIESDEIQDIIGGSRRTVIGFEELMPSTDAFKKELGL